MTPLPTLPTLPPRYFTTPVLLAGRKTHYLALPRTIVKVPKHDKPCAGILEDQFDLVTRYQLVRCNEQGQPIQRIRRSKKQRLALRRQIAAQAAAL